MRVMTVASGLKNVMGRLNEATFSRPRLRRLISTVLILNILTSGVGSFVTVRNTHLPDDAAFKVGEHIVTISELEKRVDTLRSLYGVQPPSGGKKLDKFRRASAKSFAVSMLLDQAAQEKGIVVAKKSAQSILGRFIEKQFTGGGQAARDKFIKTLGNVGTSWSAVLEEVRRQMTISRLFERVTQSVSVSNEKMRQEFADRREQLGRPERRKIYNIVVRSKEQAQSLLQKLEDGTQFASLAQEYSLDESTRGKGGKLGTVAKSQLEKKYADAAFSVDEGKFFGPVKSRFGWNVGKIEKVLPPKPAKYSDTKKELRRVLESEQALRKWRSWLKEQIKKAEIQYAEEYRPKNPTEPPKVGPAQSPKRGPSTTESP